MTLKSKKKPRADGIKNRSYHTQFMTVSKIRVGSIWTLNYCAQPYCAQFFSAQIYCAQFYCAQNYCAQFF